MLFVFAAFAVSAAQSASVEFEPWPTARPGPVLSTPDWSDYRIYPKAALRKEQEGRVVPELLVGADGKPTACRVLLSSNFKELDAGTCELMMQMRFEPARDPAGVPVPSKYVRPIAWGLTEPRPFASSSMSARVGIEGGKLRTCDVVGGEGPYVAFWSGFACRAFADVDYYFGKRSKEALQATISVRLVAAGQADGSPAPARVGSPIATEKIAFVVNGEGDPSECRPIESEGFGPRGLNSLSPCGRLLSGLWFQSQKPGEPPRQGMFETRVFAVEAD